MNGRRHLLTAFLGLTLLLPAAARTQDDAGIRSPFARGAGGRPLALGGAYVGVSGDAAALVWNPAGLGAVDRPGLYASHSDLVGLGFHEQFAVVALPSWRLGTFALALRRYGVDGIEQRDDRGIILADDLQDSETEIAFGYGRALGAAWAVGASAKLQQQSLAGTSDAGLGLDLGVQVKPLLAAGGTSGLARGLTLGVQLRNVLQPSLRLKDEDVSDPAAVRTGLALELARGQHLRLLATADLEKTQDMDARRHAGLEVDLLGHFALRAGSHDGMLTAGTGIRWNRLEVDYSFEDNPLESVHRFGLGFGFGTTVVEKRQSALDREERHLQERLATAFARQNASRLESLLQRTRDALAAGDHEGVQQLAATVRVLSPQNETVDDLEAASHLKQATGHEAAGDLASAALAYSRCLALSPDDVQAAAGLQRVSDESDRQSARSDALRGLFDQAMAAYTAGDLVSARDHFAEMLAGNPGDAEAEALLAHTRQTLNLRVESLVDQARTLSQAGNLEAGRKLLADASRLVPDHREIQRAQQEIGALAARRQAADQDRARAAVAPVAAPVAVPAASRLAFARLPHDRQEEVKDLYARGLAAARGSRRDDALRYWELVWSSAPDYQQVGEHLMEEYLARGMEAYAGGDLKAAIELWEKTTRIDPDDSRARGYLARAREQQDRIREIRSEK